MRIFVLVFLLLPLLHAGTTFAELQEQLMTQITSPFVSLTFIYDGSAEIGPILEQVIEDFRKKKEGYLNLLTVDCDTTDEDLLKNFPYCSGEIRSKLPALFYTEPYLNPAESTQGQNLQPKNHVYQGTLQDKNLYNFALPLMKLYSINLKKSSDWHKFQQSYPQTPKVLYFTDKDKISPFFKTLTAHFRHTIAFGHVFKNSSLCQQFGITKFPSLLLNGQIILQMSTDLLKQVQILKQHEGPKTKIVIEQMTVQAFELDQENVQQKIYQNPRHILVHIPGTDGQPHAQWKKSKQNFRKMFDYYETTTLATKFGVKHRPALVYFPKSLVKKDLKKTVFHPSDTFRTIYDEISELIEDFTVPMANDAEMQKMTSISLSQGKLIAVLFHKDDISLSYRVLSNDNRFKDSLTFLRMKNPEDEVVKKFGIKKLPTLLVMTVDDSNETQAKNAHEKQEEGKKSFSLKIAQYTGKYNYDQLETYLNYFLQKPASSSQSQSTRSAVELNNKKKFEQGCVQESCYLLLLDNSPEKASSTSQYVKILQSGTAGNYQNVGYLDAKCHGQILTKLQIYTEDLPVLIYLNSKFQKYSRLVGRIEAQSIKTFISKVKANKGIWRAYEALSFQNKNCIKQHQRIKQLEQSGSEMSKQEAEILQEIKKQEEEKKLQAAASGEGQSKKKRKRRRPKQQDSL